MDWLKVSAPSFAFAGVQASWAVLIGHGTAHLRKLGLSNELLGFAWLAGPTTGLIVQPIIGGWSDRCTSRFGRRKPFLLGGALGLAAGLLIFSNSANIAAALGDPISPNGGGSHTGLFIAICAFWVTDLFNNVLQCPSRCLMADYATSGETLSVGNSLMAVGNGIGKVIGYAVGSFTSRIEIVYGAIAGVAVLLSILTCILSDDEPSPGKNVDVEEGALKDTSPSNEKSFFSVFSLHTLFNMPRAVAKAFLIQTCTYFAFMFLFVYGSNWSGKEVFNGRASAAPGSPVHQAYERGILVANRGLLCMAILSVVIAMILTPICRRVGVKPVWSASLLCLGACMMATVFVQAESATGVYAVFSFLSFPLAVAFTIPWTIASLAVREELGEAAKHDLGAHMAIFNGSQAFACLIAAILGGFFVRAMDGDIAKVMAIGGSAAVVGSGLVWWADIPVGLEEMQINSLVR